MVDSRKSIQARQQRRRANGEFAEEQDTGLPSGDTLTDFERKRLNNAMLAAETNIIMDPDVADCAGYATRRLDELIARPAKPGETDDMPLIIENLRYDPQAPGGSHADYIADHIEAAYAGIPVKAPDRTQLEQETRQHILETALDPNRELHKLGLEPVQLGEHTNAYTGPQPEDWVGDYDEEAAERRYEAAWKGKQTKKARYDAATEKHLSPLNDDMRDLFEKNVDRGLINGSAFDDKMAFADTLHELQDDGWNPEKGKEYRQSKDFKKLENSCWTGGNRLADTVRCATHCVTTNRNTDGSWPRILTCSTRTKRRRSHSPALAPMSAKRRCCAWPPNTVASRGRSPWHAGIRASNTRCRTRNTTRSAWSMTGRESDT